jgi:hypothetical protein
MSFAASVRAITADYCKSEKSISTLSLITSDSPELFFDEFDLITLTPELLDLQWSVISECRVDRIDISLHFYARQNLYALRADEFCCLCPRDHC